MVDNDSWEGDISLPQCASAPDAFYRLARAGERAGRQGDSGRVAGGSGNWIFGMQVLLSRTWYMGLGSLRVWVALHSG